jgi:hypothetical protein
MVIKPSNPANGGELRVGRLAAPPAGTYAAKRAAL